MKKAILACAMFVTAITSFAQTTPDVKTKEDYLRKSRHQKTTAWIMLGGGLVLVGVGFAATAGSVSDTDTDNTGANIIAYTGVASALGSIPLFIAAGRNKRKAASLSFNMQSVPAPFRNNSIAIKKQPALTFPIAL